jgi:hypothetical protein
MIACTECKHPKVCAPGLPEKARSLRAFFMEAKRCEKD